MNAGFSNFDTLRAHVMGDALKTVDPKRGLGLVLATIGVGMAHRVEKYLNRRLAWKTGEVEIIPADRANFLLGRYPVYQVTQIQVKLTDADGWEDQTPLTDFYQTVDLDAGIVMCDEGSDIGPHYAQVQFTYDGGFFWEQLEPSDAGYPSQSPAGAVPLPSDIQNAWLLFCQNIWAKRDKLGLGLVDKPDEQSNLADIKTPPLVKEMLESHVRPQMV